RKCADNLKLTIEKVQDVDMVAKGVANGELLIKGIVYVQLRVKDKNIKTPVLVVDGETTIRDDEILLGTNFTSQFICTYTDEGIYLDGKFYPKLEELVQEGSQIQKEFEKIPTSRIEIETMDEEDKIYAKFDTVISKDDLDISNITIDIPRKMLNNKTYRRPPRFRYSPLQEALIVSYVQRLLDKGIVIRKETPFVTNFILVQPKSSKGEVRFAVDLRALNEITQPDMYVTKTPMELMNYLSKAELFSTLDIRKAFWGMRIPNEDIKYYGVYTPMGTVCFVRVPFGDINAMANFQRIYDTIIRESIPNNSVAYVDDLIIYSKNNTQKHVKLVNEAMKGFAKYGIKINKDKSLLLQKSIKFLGWEIFNGTRKPGNQIQTLKERRNPNSPKEVKSLLGALNFFRDAVDNYSNIVRPMQECSNVLKKDFMWTSECEMAKLEVFRALDTILLIPRFDQPFYIYTDASMYALAGCILQIVENKLYPVKFYSKKVKHCKRAKSINLLEMQAIACTLVANLELLYLSEIKIFTDNKSVLAILRDGVDPDYSKYIAMISSFNYTIQYINTKDNTMADYISRQEWDDKEQVVNCNVMSLMDKENIIQDRDEYNLENMEHIEHENDLNKNGVETEIERVKKFRHNVQQLQELDMEMANDIKKEPGKYIKLNKVWHIKMFLQEEEKEILVPVIPKQLRKTVIEMVHDGNGHVGYRKTWRLLKMLAYWPNYKKEVRNHIRSCDICQKYSDMRPELPLLKHSQLPTEPFRVIAIDVGVVPGYGLVLQAICSLTRFWIPQVIKDQTTQVLIQALNKGVFLRVGVPERIICDSYPSFISSEFKHFMDTWGVELHITTPYAKTKNSIVERSFRTMWDLIGKMKERCGEPRMDFETMVLTAAYYYNTNYQLTLDESPFLLVFNKKEKPFMLRDQGIAMVDKFPELTDTLASIRNGWESAIEKANSNRIQDNERKNVKENRGEPVFQMGEKVLIKNYVKGKLDGNYIGPYIVVRREGNEYSLRKEENIRGRLMKRSVNDILTYVEALGQIQNNAEKEKDTNKIILDLMQK
ncbi:Reverse transcriptase domain and Integrase, catalytic core domain and Ribonuclease H-like domain-containing protein, partial [Strongyloides ratti]